MGSIAILSLSHTFSSRHWVTGTDVKSSAYQPNHHPTGVECLRTEVSRLHLKKNID